MKNMFLIPLTILIGGALFAYLFHQEGSWLASKVSLFLSICGAVWLLVDIEANRPVSVSRAPVRDSIEMAPDFGDK